MGFQMLRSKSRKLEYLPLLTLVNSTINDNRSLGAMVTTMIQFLETVHSRLHELKQT